MTQAEAVERLTAAGAERVYFNTADCEHIDGVGVKVGEKRMAAGWYKDQYTPEDGLRPFGAGYATRVISFWVTSGMTPAFCGKWRSIFEGASKAVA